MLQPKTIEMSHQQNQKRETESYYKNIEKNKTADVLTNNGSDREEP